MSREIIAILRGVEPDKAADIGMALVEAGITRVEVPMNSPQPLRSIEALGKRLERMAEIGAGTVLAPRDVAAVNAAGGTFIVSPNCDIEVIAATKEMQMESFPGVLTPTECFAALHNGADALKFFPASLLGIDGFSAIKAVLPRDVKTYAVGGVGAADFESWLVAGVNGFGIGSGIFKPGFNSREVAERAEKLVQSFDRVVQQLSLADKCKYKVL